MILDTRNMSTVLAEPRFQDVGSWDLTVVTQFDNYRTVPTKLSPSAHLLPGQFERIAKALSDPRRFAMLEAIGQMSGCPNQQLCHGFPVSKATISHHLKELVNAGLIETEREGQYMSVRACPDVLKAYTEELMRRVSGSPGS
jgi:ArsR family transcriptional regulator